MRLFLVGLFVVIFGVVVSCWVYGSSLVELAKPKAKIVFRVLDVDEVKVERVRVELFVLRGGSKVRVESKEVSVGKEVVFVVGRGRYEVVVVGGREIRREVDVREDRVYVVSVSEYSLKEGGLVLYCGFESEEELKQLGGVVNRMSRNENEGIEFVEGFEGRGMYIRGEHEESTTYDQVFIPLQGELTTEGGTVEFYFKPVGWNSSDKCAVHYLVFFVEKPSAYNRFHNLVNDKAFLGFAWHGWSGNWEMEFCARARYLGKGDRGWGYDSEIIKGMNRREFRAGEWMRFRVVWSRDKGVLG
ncbi:MAG: hypothetical protein ABDH28_02875, partial [Brevinematia bacterium]